MTVVKKIRSMNGKFNKGRVYLQGACIVNCIIDL